LAKICKSIKKLVIENGVPFTNSFGIIKLIEVQKNLINVHFRPIVEGDYCM